MLKGRGFSTDISSSSNYNFQVSDYDLYSVITIKGKQYEVFVKNRNISVINGDHGYAGFTYRFSPIVNADSNTLLTPEPTWENSGF